MGSSNVNRRAHNMKWIMKQSTLCNLHKLYRKRTAPSISDNSEQNGEEVAGEWWLDGVSTGEAVAGESDVISKDYKVYSSKKVIYTQFML